MLSLQIRKMLCSHQRWGRQCSLTRSLSESISPEMAPLCRRLSNFFDIAEFSKIPHAKRSLQLEGLRVKHVTREYIRPSYRDAEPRQRRDGGAMLLTRHVQNCTGTSESIGRENSSHRVPSAPGSFENEAQFSFKRRRQFPTNSVEQERQCGSITSARPRKAAVRSFDPAL
jgi:hypothetical protein